MVICKRSINLPIWLVYYKNNAIIRAICMLQIFFGTGHISLDQNGGCYPNTLPLCLAHSQWQPSVLRPIVIFTCLGNGATDVSLVSLCAWIWNQTAMKTQSKKGTVSQTNMGSRVWIPVAHWLYTGRNCLCIEVAVRGQKSRRQCATGGLIFPR